MPILCTAPVESLITQYVGSLRSRMSFLLCDKLHVCSALMMLTGSAVHSMVLRSHYRIAGNFCEVYILRFSRFNRICESLSHKFVIITIQMHNTITQIAKLIPRNVCLSAKLQNFMTRIFFAIRYAIESTLDA